MSLSFLGLTHNSKKAVADSTMDGFSFGVPTQRAGVMSYVWNWIAFGVVMTFCVHSAFQSYKQWRSERQFDKSDNEAG